MDQLKDWEAVVRPRRVAGVYERGRTILGEAGSGKSTLVRRIADLARDKGDWVTSQLRIPLGADPLKSVASALLALASEAGLASAREQRIKEAMTQVRAVAAAGISLTLDRAEGPEPYFALTRLLVEIGQAAARADVAVLIHIDEVQNITNDEVLSQLLVCLGDAIAHEVDVAAPGGVRFTRYLPLAVYLTGLPEFHDMAGARKGATFARRFASTTLESIEDDDFRLALRIFIDPGWEIADAEGRTSHIWMEPQAVERMVSLCRGEPFLFQLAGERAWYAGDGDLITEAEVIEGWTAARPEAKAHVERILDRLPPRERELLDVMADMDSDRRTLTTIAKGMGYTTASQAGPLAQRLDIGRGIINRGSLYSFRHRAVEAYLTSSWPDVSA